MPAAAAQLPPILPPTGGQPSPEPQPAPPQPQPAATQPAGSPPQLRGVQLHPLWEGVTSRDSDRQLRIAREAGATVVRIDMTWASIEQAGRGRVNWHYVRRADAFMRLARRHRLPVVVTLWGTPCWASRAPARLRRGCRGRWWDRGVTAYPPRASRDFARVAAWVAGRWHGQMAAIELWNEPNQRFFFRSANPARDYSRLVRSSYRPIKRAAPAVEVLAGAFAYSDADFLTALYERGRIAGSYDAISYHPYTDGRSPRARAGGTGPKKSFPDGTSRLRQVMGEHGDTGEMWITEVGASTCHGAPTCVDEATQADHVRGFLEIAAGMPFARAVVVYALRDNATPANRPSGRFGLLRHDLRPKPAFGAFREAVSR